MTLGAAGSTDADDTGPGADADADAETPMPTYLCRGFRWKRRSIRVYVVVQNLDDAAPEWIIKRGSAQSLIESFYNLFDFLPECKPPPARSSRSSISTDRNSIGDDDGASDTTRTGRSGSRSQGRAAAAQEDQGPFHHVRDDENPTGPTGTRKMNSEGRSSSRDRSRSGEPEGPIRKSTDAPSTYAAHHSPSSPPCLRPHSPASDHRPQGERLDLVLSQDWSPVKLLEEYDPNNLDEVSRPYAYVADHVQRIDASCSVLDEIAKLEQQVRSGSEPAGTEGRAGETLTGDALGAGWLEKLRDQLQRDEEIKWYVVVNGDEERAWLVVRTISRPEPREQTVHHAQYTHQHAASRGQDRDLEASRQQLRRELGFEDGSNQRVVSTRPEAKPNVSEADSTEVAERKPLRMDIPIPRQPVAASRPKTAKTPGKALRKFFGRSKTP